MGNRSSSPPCLEDSLSSTLSWAEGRACPTVMPGCHDSLNATQSSLSVDSDVGNKNKNNDPQQMVPEDCPPEIRRRIAEALPTLTDCSLSASSDDERVEHPGLRRAATSTSSEQESCGRSGFARNNSDALSISNISLLWRGAMSGSFERDARIDLGTSRGSSGLRQGDDERDDKDLCPRE